MFGLGMLGFLFVFVLIIGDFLGRRSFSMP